MTLRNLRHRAPLTTDRTILPASDRSPCATTTESAYSKHHPPCCASDHHAASLSHPPGNLPRSPCPTISP
jgi:hypothetical protein